MVPMMVDPFKELRDLEKDLERRLSSMLDFVAPPASLMSTQKEPTSWIPAVNEKEDEKAYYLEIDLPGVKKEDINVEVKDNMLIISGERKFKKEEKDKGYKKIESFFGKFERKFTLPPDANVDKIEAKVEDGVLTIIIPRQQQKEDVKRIAIK
ncbi:MAG: Hsp20/alpha crystallin family protein [Epsilonproteobacteria bacterium]|nr:Hsp20/alpha crystallin family protein [Campylobacterota bacterium]